MAAIAELKAFLKMDTQQFEAGMGKASKTTSKFQQTMKAAGGAIAAAFSMVAITRFTRAIVKAGSDLEDFETQFVNLGFSAEQAASRVKLLSEFSTKTPFQIADLVEASQLLHTFSGGLLGGVDSLKMFGDTAASVGQKDIKLVAQWVGRLFGALKNGLPFLDSANALSRLKVISSDTVKELIDMDKAGGSAADMWGTFTDALQKYEGGMERSSKTASGMVSTMKDVWIQAFGEMGLSVSDTTKGIVQSLGWVAKKIAWLVKGLQLVAATAGALSDKSATSGTPKGLSRLVTAWEKAKISVLGDPAKEDETAPVTTDPLSEASRAEERRIAKRLKEEEAAKKLADKLIDIEKRFSDKKIDLKKKTAQRIRDILNDEVGATGQSLAVSARASVGGFTGASRAGVGVADRQIQIQVEMANRQKQIERLNRDMESHLSDIKDDLSDAVAAVGGDKT
jgi:hypothetical protein